MGNRVFILGLSGNGKSTVEPCLEMSIRDDGWVLVASTITTFCFKCTVRTRKAKILVRLSTMKVISFQFQQVVLLKFPKSPSKSTFCTHPNADLIQ